MARTAARRKNEDHQAHRTNNHKIIQKWVEARDGHPAVVEGTEILRIDFDEPDGEDEKLERISWERFFSIFDSRELEFLYQDHTQAGKESRFNKFVRGGEDE